MDPCRESTSLCNSIPRSPAWRVWEVLQSRGASVQEMGWLQVTSPWLCPCSGRNELKGLGFLCTLQPGSDYRAVHRQEVCGELWHAWLGLVSFLLHHCLFFSAGGRSLLSTFAACSEPGQQNCVTPEVVCEGRAAVKPCCARPVLVRIQGGSRKGT